MASSETRKGDGLVRVRNGRVVEIVARHDAFTEALVEIESHLHERAISIHALTGPLEVGDEVVLNTTAVALGLGTGGYHFVMAVSGRTQDFCGQGHIMKVRYTPSQVSVQTVEEEGSPYRSEMEGIPDLEEMPALVGTLHSQLPIVAGVIRSSAPGARIAYIMTDGAALPAAFSRLARKLRANGVIDAVLTTGHAFGGEFETVTPQSAFAAAKAVAKADVIIAAMGPGVVGTGTSLGTTALEQGPLLDTAGALGAAPIGIVRASGADARERHQGISHHSITALTRFTQTPVRVPLSSAPTQTLTDRVRRQADLIAARGHQVVWEDGKGAYAVARALLERHDIRVTTMGRSDAEDPYFFWITAAAGASALRLLKSELRRESID